MSTATYSPNLRHSRPRDRLTITLFIAASLHLLVVVGVGFEHALQQPQPNTQRTLEIILAPQQSLTAPEEADFLAQTHQQGSGDLSEHEALASAPELEPVQPLEQEHERNLLPQIAAAPVQPPTPHELTSQQAGARPPPQDRDQPPTPELPENLSASQLIETSMQNIMRLTSEIERRQQSYREQPRRNYISASTEAYLYASYMDAWRDKVERVGNLNYPDEARRQGLSGSLVLEVVLRPDGSIEEIQILRSSGQQILDDAAIRIVRLSAPFGPFPDSIREETDLLHITRTWQFLAGDRLRTTR